MFETLPWQELVFFLGNIIFFLGLIPSIISANKPSFWTCLLSAPTLSTFSLTFASLNMIVSALGIGLCALAWWALFFQTWPRKAAAPEITKN